MSPEEFQKQSFVCRCCGERQGPAGSTICDGCYARLKAEIQTNAAPIARFVLSAEQILRIQKRYGSLQKFLSQVMRDTENDHTTKTAAG